MDTKKRSPIDHLLFATFLKGRTSSRDVWDHKSGALPYFMVKHNFGEKSAADLSAFDLCCRCTLCPIAQDFFVG